MEDSSSGEDLPNPEESTADGPRDGPRDGSETVAADWQGLPEPIRARLAELAGASLDRMRGSDVPAQIRPIMRFAAVKRAKLGQIPLVSALWGSSKFRAAVREWCREHRAEALDTSDADPAVAGAAALLVDSPIARHYVELVAFRTERGNLRHDRDAAQDRAARLESDVHRLRGELDQARRAVRDSDAYRGDDADRMRKRLREQGVRLKEAKDDAQRARADLEQERAEQRAELERMHVKLERARSRESDAQRRAEQATTEIEVARQSAREARQGDEVRLGLLLETLEGAVGGLRRELSPSGSGPLPADSARRGRDVGGSGVLTDQVTLDRILQLPAVHVIVDGYNVTKTGYPELPLADQRDRLARQLAVLAARVDVEVTVVFDGADVRGVPTTGPRGVRVLFSDPGVQADDVIRDVVAAEPWGRQLVVVTSDREIVDSVTQHRAYAVPAAMLLARLNRV